MLHAQNEMDVLRYSYRTLEGTARSQAMGGAMSAVGADFSSLSTNPAGLAQYRSNQLLFGVGLVQANQTLTYIGNTSEASTSNLHLPQVGFAFTHINRDKGKEVKEGVVSYTFAFNAARHSSLNRSRSLNGFNNSSSMIDYYAQRADGSNAGNLSSDIVGLPGLAWNAYLINPIGVNNVYVANLPDQITMQQQMNWTETGRISEYNAGFAVNISHTILIGGALSLHRSRFESNYEWTETTRGFFSSPRTFTFNEMVTQNGTGWNAKLGILAKLNDNFRVGVHYINGVRYNVNDEFSRRMSSTRFDSINNRINLNSGIFSNELQIQTPERIGVGLAYVIPKVAVFTLDIENIDYGDGSLGDQNGTLQFREENLRIRNNFRSVNNLRLGGEILNLEHRYRAGYAFFPSPISEQITGKSQGTHHFTFGYGYRNSTGFFLDFAAVFSRFRDFYTPYTLENTTRISYTAEQLLKRNWFTLGIGTTF